MSNEVQVAIAREIAEQFQISPGDHLVCVAEKDTLRVIPSLTRKSLSLEDRLRLFDQTTSRIMQSSQESSRRSSRERGWTREDLYTRGGTN